MSAKQGEKHHKAKLTADDVRDIRARRAAGETIESIWLSFPEIQSASTIGYIVRRRTWRHVQ
ncbi:hypothetical protein [Streptomyces sp. NPDC057854]|uniref:hypothetical protein n=1 Tax=unclassified Streptomyces TaxID=2593676 RepID=UPI00368C0DBE